MIATLNQLNNENHIIEVLSNKFITGVRFNTGVRLHVDKKVAIARLKQLCDLYKKELWIDLKGRQLRILSWGDPLYESIKLNHNVQIKGKAVMYLRNDSEPYEVTGVKDNEIFLNKKPRNAVGAGQSVNIVPCGKYDDNTSSIGVISQTLNSEVNINGYLTASDIEYLEICKVLGIQNIMASFIEEEQDILDIWRIHKDARIVCKIESKKGINFVYQKYTLIKRQGLRLMAARDDLFIEYGRNINQEIKGIIGVDEYAICASKIFTSLKNNKYPELTDYSDLELMFNYGYRNFMLCDNVSEFAFGRAISAWEEFIKLK